MTIYIKKISFPRVLVATASYKLLTESRIDAYRLLCVFERLGQRDELGVCQRAIIVSACVAGVPLDALSIALHRPGKVSLFKQSIALLARHGRQRRVDVRSAVRGRLGALDFLKFIQDVRRAVFREGLFVEPDCVGQVVLFGVGRADATICFCDELVIRAKLRNMKNKKNTPT